MAAYLAETIESVLKNLGPNDHYFVVDGGSTDGSVDLIKTYEGRISGWISEPDQGYADAVAKGFAMAPTRYQCWIACGDLMLPGALQLASTELARTGADMIYGDNFYVDENSRLIQITSAEIKNLAEMMFYGGWTPLQDACFWSSELYQRVGGINPAIRYAADYDLFLRMAMAGQCVYTPHVFSAFRRHEGQTSERYKVAYRNEKEAAAKSARNSMNAVRSSIGAKVYHWIYPKLRARISSLSAKPIKTSSVGRPVHECRAALSSIY